ncbi:MAG: hypothetical protein KBH23_04910 [Bacteroidaceae bacterium]|nr:hypothetical protein [Bacteroidaceae bacterium]
MKKYFPILYGLGAICVLAGLVMKMPGLSSNEYAPYVVIFGSLLLYTQFSPRFGAEQKDQILKRLYRQRNFGLIFITVTGVLMITLPHGNEWMLSLLIGAITTLYAAYRIPMIEKKKGLD